MTGHSGPRRGAYSDADTFVEVVKLADGVTPQSPQIKNNFECLKATGEFCTCRTFFCTQ